jgi:hypothetical protein
MRKFIPGFFIILYFLISGFDVEPENFEYNPIFMLRSELEKSVRLESPRILVNPGKIYLKDDLIFINEKYIGIHVIDNSNPSEPENIAFLHIDGCIDMAMKDNVLYADNAVDLVSLLVKPDLTGIQVTSRIKNVFPELLSPDGRGLSSREQMARPENSILVRWKHR